MGLDSLEGTGPVGARIQHYRDGGPRDTLPPDIHGPPEGAKRRSVMEWDATVVGETLSSQGAGTQATGSPGSWPFKKDVAEMSQTVTLDGQSRTTWTRTVAGTVASATTTRQPVAETGRLRISLQIPTLLRWAALRGNGPLAAWLASQTWRTVRLSWALKAPSRTSPTTTTTT